MLNSIFNMGFIISDTQWLVSPVMSANTEAEWYFRHAFVVGDLYMRFFYRSLASAKHLLK